MNQQSPIGLTIPLRSGEVVITRQLISEASGKPSTFYESKDVDGNIKPVHENVVNAVLAGTYEPDPIKVKGPRKVSTKKERATKHVTAMKRQRMSRGEIIKALAKKLRCSRATAQTYYYSVK